MCFSAVYLCFFYVFSTLLPLKAAITGGIRRTDSVEYNYLCRLFSKFWYLPGIHCTYMEITNFVFKFCRDIVVRQFCFSHRQRDRPHRDLDPTFTCFSRFGNSQNKISLSRPLCCCATDRTRRLYLEGLLYKAGIPFDDFVCRSSNTLKQPCLQCCLKCISLTHTDFWVSFSVNCGFM